jgi:microcystin-dependent protein
MYQAPLTVWNGDYVARLVIIPNLREINNALNDGLVALTYPQAWSGDGTMTPEEIATEFLKALRGSFEYQTNMIGQICFFPFEPPSNYLKFDGVERAATDYAYLHSVLPSDWKTADHFTLPDMTGKYIVSTGVSAYVGEVVGNNNLSLEVANIPALTVNYTGAIPAIINGGLEAPAPAAEPSPLTTTTGGTGEAFDNRPESMKLICCIRAKV